MNDALIVNPQATRDELQEGIDLLLHEAKGIAGILQEQAKGHEQLAIFNLYNHIDYIDQMWTKYRHG